MANIGVLKAFESITAAGAMKMAEIAVIAAETMGLQKGYFIVVGLKDPSTPLVAVPFGEGGAAGRRIAEAKVDTVMGTGRSTHLQREYMSAERLDRADYAGVVRTLFGGGRLICADPECTKPVGAAAFSGGEEKQDMAIVEQAAWSVGLFAQ